MGWTPIRDGMGWGQCMGWYGMGTVHGILSCMYLVGSWTLAY